MDPVGVLTLMAVSAIAGTKGGTAARMASGMVIMGMVATTVRTTSWATDLCATVQVLTVANMWAEQWMLGFVLTPQLMVRPSIFRQQR